MSTAATVVGMIVFIVGLLMSFLRDRLHGRLVGFGGMSGGALLVLIDADPSAAAGWWMAVTGALTLAGLLTFGALLGRWTARASGNDAAHLDDVGA